MEEQDLAIWVESARRGDTTARARLLDALQDRWYRFAYSLAGSEDQAREAVQETAVRFLERLGGFRQDSSLGTWSLGIVLNVVREQRRIKRTAYGELDDRPAANDGGPERNAQQQENWAALAQGLKTLAPRQREMIVLRFLEGMSVEETARLLECAPGTVKATVFQSLRILKKELEARP